MDKNNEQKNNKTPEMKPKQDSFRPWLKLIPAAAVFAAVCVTCYQADKVLWRLHQFPIIMLCLLMRLKN